MSAIPSDDAHLADLRHLAAKTATVLTLEVCPALLELISGVVVEPGEPAYVKVRALRRTLLDVLDRAHTAVTADDQDSFASMVLAAGAIMGLVTEQHNGYTCPPSAMTKKASAKNKEARQQLAADWLLPPAADARRVRECERECLDAFRHALLDYMEALQRASLRSEAPSLANDQRAEAGSADDVSAQSDPIAASSDTPTNGQSMHYDDESKRVSGRRHLAFGTGALLLAVGALFAGIAIASGDDPPDGPPGKDANLQGNGSISSVAVPGRTYLEQAGHNRTMTTSDPFHPRADRPELPALQKVQVSCKLHAVPQVGYESVMPDGYWYRIASPPWNNRYFGIANTFLNGQPVENTSQYKTINTDWRVPDC